MLQSVKYKHLKKGTVAKFDDRIVVAKQMQY